MKLKLITLLILLFVPAFLMAQGKYRVNTTKLNVRVSPSVKARAIGSLKKGDLVMVKSIANGWALIKYKSKERYVSAKYLTLISAAEDESKPTQKPAKTETYSYQKTNDEIPPRSSSRNQEAQEKYYDDDDEDRLSLFVSGFAGMTSFSWSGTTPKYGIAYGGGVGLRYKYNLFSRKIPSGLFGDLTVEYAHRGSNAYPIDYISTHFQPIGYTYSFNHSIGVFVKAGGYFAYPISGSIGRYNTRMDYGLSGAVGFRFKRFELSGSYDYGFADITDNAPVELKNMGAILTLSYHFKLK